MNRINENRREFLTRTLLAGGLAVPFLLNCKNSTLAQKAEDDVLTLIRKNAIQDSKDEWWGAHHVPDGVRWKTKLSKEGEAGQPLLISGTVFSADGKNPAPNVLIYLYHTDIYGHYGQSGEHRHGRYRGWMLTDEKGRYSFLTIKPASYPDTTIAAHIHMTLTGVDFKEDWVDSILFEGDSFINERQRIIRKGGFDPILQLEEDADGILRGTRDIQCEKV